jgi:RNA polymerase sporulation-specific sigma factor
VRLGRLAAAALIVPTTTLTCPDEVIREPQVLAHHIAHQYYAPGLDHDDLVQEALVGLCEAWHDYDPARNIEFTKFAAMCMKRELFTVIRLARTGKREILNKAVSLDGPVTDERHDGTEPPRLGGVLAGGVDPAVVAAGREQLAEIVDIFSRRCSPTEQEALAIVLNGESYINRPDAKRIDNAIQRARRKLKAAP